MKGYNSDQMGQWLKGVIRATLKGQPAESLLMVENKKGTLTDKLSMTIAEYLHGVYEFAIGNSNAMWVYQHNVSKDMLYLYGLNTPSGTDESLVANLHALFPVGNDKRASRPSRLWLSHDTVFVQLGYFMRMSGTTSQYKLGFRWDKTARSELYLTPDHTYAAAWFDVYDPSQAIPFASESRTQEVYRVQQQVTGEWRIYANIPISLAKTVTDASTVDAPLGDN